jgi:hypothetical protein
MDAKLAEYIDQQRWLMNNALITDGAKNQLFVFGAIVHKNIHAIEMDLKVESKTVIYHLYVQPRLHRALRLYDRLFPSQSIFNMWRLRRLLRKEGNLNFSGMLNQFVKDFCGPQWKAEVDVRLARDYSPEVISSKSTSLKDDEKVA